VIEQPPPRTITLGRIPLDTHTLTKLKSLYDEVPDIPLRLWVPHHRASFATRTLKQVWGDLAAHIEVVWHAESDSWALVGPKLVIMALHPRRPQ
jgi:hypothetical protein